MRMPQTRAPAKFSVIVFFLDAFSSVHPNTHIYAFSFSNRCVCDENALRISADGRPKHIEMYAFSNENASVWTRPKSPRVFHIRKFPVVL